MSEKTAEAHQLLARMLHCEVADIAAGLRDSEIDAASISTAEEARKALGQVPTGALRTLPYSRDWSNWRRTL